jgi:hypothetical protein
VNDEYEATRRLAWRNLRRGGLFLAFCVLVSESAGRLAFPGHHLLMESVTIAGWVALWKPIEMFLYELPEMRRRRRETAALPAPPSAPA